jgi:cobalt-zinc-cadmium resistance protein CzcA
MKSKNNIVIVLLLLLSISQVQAQKQITIEEAFQLLPKQNIEMKAGLLQQQYLQALQATAGEMPKTAFVSELGQINSLNFDNRFSLMQTFLPFGSIGQQKSLLASSLMVFEKEMQLRKADLRLLVRQLFTHYYHQQEIEAQLQSIDTMYGRLIELSEQRIKTGEANKLEVHGFRQKEFMIQQQIAQCKLNKSKYALQLQVILQTAESAIPAGNWQTNATTFLLQDSAVVMVHPYIQVKQEQQKAAAAETAFEKAKRNPELMVGYNNQSLIGYQTLQNGTEKYFNAGNRFSSGQIGIAFPLLGKASKAKVASASVKEKTLEKEIELQKSKLKGEWQWRISEQQLLWSQILLYKNTMLPESEGVKQLALQLLKSGELSYLNWMALVEPALQTPFQYLDKFQEYQMASAYLYYLTEKQ